MVQRCHLFTVLLHAQISIRFSSYFQALHQLYYDPDIENKNLAQKWLMQAQVSPQAWQFCWALLSPEKVKHAPKRFNTWTRGKRSFTHFGVCSRSQRSSTSERMRFTPRSPATGLTSPRTSTSLWRLSCSPRSPASLLAPRWCSPDCVWLWLPWRSTQCLKPGPARWRRWCACSRRRGEGWTGAHVAWHCWSSSQSYRRSSKPADCPSTAKDRYELVLLLQVVMATWPLLPLFYYLFLQLEPFKPQKPKST